MLADFKLERYFSQYEFSSPYLLGGSDCETVSVQEILDLEGEAGLNSMQTLRLGYTEGQGSLELREQITRLYHEVNEGDILVTAGAEETIFLFMNTALQPGDHVIVQHPCYQSLYELARSIGCRVSLWEMQESNDWALNFDFLLSIIEKNTRAVVVNMPHNPTGYLMSRGQWQNLIEVLKERNILLFSDEVYRGLEYDESHCLQPACDLYDNAVSLGVMSKSYGLAGLRIGWAATRNRDLYRRMASLKDYTSICNSAPSELLATIALKHARRLILRNLQIIENNIKIVDDFFRCHRQWFAWVKPRAGSVAFPRMLPDRDVDQFCMDLAAKEKVILLPGSCYNFNSHFRIGLGRKNLPRCLEGLERFVKEFFIIKAYKKSPQF